MIARASALLVALASAATAQPAPADGPEGDAAEREAEMFGAPPAATPGQPSAGGDARDREAEMFGASVERPADPPPGDREAALFGAPAVEPPPDAAGVGPINPGLDALTIGGRLWLRLDAFVFDETDATDQRVAMPNLLDVFLDARPVDRVRAYASARLIYDPTVAEADPADPVDPLAAAFQSQNGVSLNELWLRFDVERRVFFTLGAQRIRWGAARVWNPTDVLNRQRLDPLAPADLRTGTPILRAEIPIAALNGSFTLAGQLDGAGTVGQVGGAARLQMAADGLEASLTAAARVDQPALLGLDVSAGLGPFDLYTEGVISRGGGARRWVGSLDLATNTFPRAEDRDDDWILQGVLGVEWPIAYSDDDLLILGAEYLFNDAGYPDAGLYPWLIGFGDYTPFYLGRHYLAAFAVLATPGSWDDTSLVLTSVNNLSDGTGVARLNVSHAVRRRLFVEPYVAMVYGERGGEFRFSGRFPDGDGGEVAIPPPLGQVGLWLRVGF